MCTIYPECLPDTSAHEIVSRAEIKLYEQLSSQLGSDWTVFYRIAWLGYSSKDRPEDGETDFIVAHPEKGALVIEVKGGSIRYDGGKRQWISTDRSGFDHDIDPFRQVVESKYALIRKLNALVKRVHRESSPLLQEVRRHSGSHGSFLPLYHAVAFPDVIKPDYDVTPDSPTDIIIDKNDMHSLERKLHSIFGYWRGQSKTKYGTCEDLIKALEDMLARTTCLRNPLRSQADEEEKEIIELTEQQFRLLDFMNRHRWAAIGGCAGSGKTLMAAEKARRLASEGFKTLLTCFNRSLAAFLKEMLCEYDCLTVSNYHTLCSDLAAQAGITVEMKENEQVFYDRLLPRALYFAARKNAELKFDAIVVDEGQDFQRLWWATLRSLLRHRRRGIFYIFFDDNQNIYNESIAIPEEMPRFELNENLRNTKKIFSLISKFYRSERQAVARGPVGRDVEILPCNGRECMAESLQKTLHRLIHEDACLPGHITVLSMKSIQKEGRSHLKDGMSLGELRLTTAPENRNDILFSNVYMYKGLENRIIIITDIDESVMSNLSRRDSICYSGFSRARNHLILMGEAAALEGIGDPGSNSGM